MEHAADCKDFDDARYIEDLKTIELRVIWKVRDCGMIGILMKKRKIVEGYYHSYHKDKFINNKDKDGRTFLTKKQISDRMKMQLH